MQNLLWNNQLYKIDTMLNTGQQIHNNLLDFEIKIAKLENRRREESNGLKIKKWNLGKDKRG